MARRIAIVEDDLAIRENYADALRRQGYDVSGYADRARALEAFRQRLPDLVIIDVGLGDDIEGGYELCRDLRAASPVLPIMFLTARDSELDVISGLRLGADDYLDKTTSLQHLIARVVTLFRRVDALRAPDHAEDVLTVDALKVEQERMRVSWQDQEIPLTVTEFWMVRALVRRPGHVKSRQQLMDEANVVVDLATVTSHIKRIRKKFVAIDADFERIETVHGIGYRWRA